MSDPQRQAKWVEKTQFIESQIRECSEHAARLRDAAGFILKQAPPLNEAMEETDEGPKMPDDYGKGYATANDSPLSLCLDGLQQMLTRLSLDLGELFNLVDL